MNPEGVKIKWLAGKKTHFLNFRLPEGWNRFPSFSLYILLLSIDLERMMLKEKDSDGRDSAPGRCKNRSRMSRGSKPDKTKGDEESN